MPSIEGGSIVDEDLLTVVAVNEADPSLRNKKFQFDELVVYLDQYFQNTSGNTFSGDIIVGGNATISGLTTTSGITVTHAATVSGLTVQDDAIVSGTISGGIVSGNTSSFNQSEIQIGTIVTLTGTTFTYSTGVVTSFFSGAVITGDTINALNFATSNFTAAYISGGTVTGISGEFGTLTAQSVTLSGVTVTDALTVSGALGVSGLLTASGAYITGTITGNTITGNSIYGTSGIFTYVSGTTITGDLISVTSGVYAHVSGATITGNNISGAGGQFAHLSGATITGDAVSATVVTGVSGVFTNISGTSGVFTNITGTNIQANRMDVETGVFQDLTAVNMTFQGDQTISGNFTVIENQVISGNLRVVGNITGESNLIIEQTGFIENIVSSGIISGSTINGNLVQANSGVYTYLSGATITGDLISGTSGVYTYVSGTSITGDTIQATSGIFVTGSFTDLEISGLVSGTSGVYTYLSGATITGDLISGTSGVFTNLSGSTITGDKIQATSGIFVTGSFTDLEISGLILSTGLFASGTESEPSITFVDNTNTGFHNAAANEVRITTNGTDRLTVNDTGRVGIGTTDPVGLLTSSKTVNGGEGGVLVIQNTGLGVGTSAALYLVPNNGGGNDLQRAASIKSRQTITGNYADLGFFTSASDTPVERLTIDSDGNVGIGTTSPGTKLAVFDSTATNSSTYISPLSVHNNGTNTNNGHKLGEGPAISFRLNRSADGAAGYSAYIRAVAEGDLGSSWPTSLSFACRRFGTDPVEIMRIGSAGRVGILTTSPQSALDINAAASTSPFIASINGSEKARIDSAGRLLVGTSSARANFYNGSNTAQIQLEGTNFQNAAFAITCNANSADKGGLIFAKSRGTTVGSNTVVQAGDDLGAIEFQGADGSEFVSGANIKAEVDGTPSANDMPGRLVFSTTADGASSPTERMRIDSSGNVGIGTTNPRSLMEVRNDNSITYDVTDDGGQRDNTATILVTNENGTTNTFSQLVFDTAGTSQSIARIAAIRTGTSTNDLAFVVEGSNVKREALRIRGNGNVGIGTTDPGRSLTVDGGAGTIIAAFQSTGTGCGFGLKDATTSADNTVTIRAIGDDLVSHAGGQERMRITSDGKVGIGTTDPNALLEVRDTANSEIRISDTAGGYANLVYNESGTVSVFEIAADPANTSTPDTELRFSVDGNRVITCLNNGNFGIGTSSPGQILTVENNNNPAILLNNSNSSNASSRSSRVALNVGGSFAAGIRASVRASGTASDADLQFGSGGDTTFSRMVIASTGNVGIGTSDPQGRLDVATAGDSSIVLANETTYTDGLKRGRITKQSDNSFVIQACDSASAVNTVFKRTISVESMRIDSSGRLLVGASSATSNSLLQVKGNTASTDAGGEMSFQRGATPTASSQGLGFIGFEDTSDNVGASIEAESDGAWATNDYPGRLIFSTTADGASSPTERMRIDSDGNVGIGTTNPSAFLDVRGGANNTAARELIAFGRPDSAVRGAMGTGVSTGNGVFFGATTNHPLALLTNNTERLRIDESGNVGIGTSDPSVPLEIVGPANSGFTQRYNVRLQDNSTSAQGVGGGISFVGKWNSAVPTAVADFALISGVKENNNQGDFSGALILGTRTNGTGSVNTERMRITSTGQVGIGTTAPGSRLSNSSTLATDGVQSAGSNSLNWQSSNTNAYIAAFENQSTGNGALVKVGDSNPSRKVLHALDGSNNSLLLVRGDGNVGIGTTNPDELLHIEGGVAEFKGTNTNAIDVTGGTEQVFKFGIEGQKNGIFGPAGSIIFRQDNRTWSSVDANNKPTRIEFCTQDNITTDTSETPRLVISSDGNVGIGATIPVALLTSSKAVSGGEGGAIAIQNASTGVDTTAALYLVPNVGAGNNLARAASIVSRQTTSGNFADLEFSVSNGANPAEAMRIASDGNVGIGTTAPGEKLTIQGTTQDVLRIKTSAVNAKLYFEASGTTSNNYIQGTGNELLVVTNGGERVRIDSSGRLLVGTSSLLDTFFGTAADKLAIAGGAAPQIIGCYSSNEFGPRLDLVKSRSSSVNGKTIVQTDDGLGEIYFGGTDGTNAIPAARIAASVDGTPGANDMPGRLVFSTTADGSSSPTERMRIKANGSILFADEDESAITAGTSNGKAILSSSIMYSARATTAAASQIIFTNTNGIVGQISTSGSNTAFSTASDYRLKENVVPLANAADRVNQLQVHRFNFIADPETTVDGFLAHEAQAVVPECVTGTKDEVDDEGNPVYQGIDQSKIVPLLTAALQEALAKIETLEQRLTDAGI